MKRGIKGVIWAPNNYVVGRRRLCCGSEPGYGRLSRFGLGSLHKPVIFQATMFSP